MGEHTTERRDEAEAAVEVDAGVEAAYHPPVRVAVVDDDTLLVAALRILFADEPTLRFVGGACTVEEGIELVARRQPDVLVVDVRMPAGGGAVVAEQARHLAPDTVVVAMSASDDDDQRAEMARAGAVSYVVKSGDRAVGDLLHEIDAVGHATGSVLPATTLRQRVLER